MERLKGKLSIVIPYYNNLKGLVRLLNSIPIKYVQVIVVDDNSDLNQSHVLIKDDFKGVSFYLNDSIKSNAGSARNLGLSKVSCPNVLFADADDYFCTDAFTYISNIIDDTFDCAYFLTDTSSDIIGFKSERNKSYNNLVRLASESSSNLDLLRYKFHVPWSKIINMKMITKHKISFDEVDVSNDVFFSTLVGAHSNIIKIYNKSIYCVTFNGTGLTSKSNKKNMGCRLNVAIRNNTYLMKIGVNKDLHMKTKGFFIRSDLSLFSAVGRGNIIRYLKYILRKYFMVGLK
ncbi:glycosyltransferase family 2 protein [Vibrio breoganii]